jgi:hypothetical protein
VIVVIVVTGDDSFASSVMVQRGSGFMVHGSVWSSFQFSILKRNKSNDDQMMIK